ncbi:MAG: MATE family efflux transporter [Massilibacteroides sp.]|nr:MATE family efflux transporter [Massilibacteroides sp.]
MAKVKDPTELGKQSISHLLKQYALPAITAMIASSLYNIADSIFIGQGVGPMGIAGLAITFPLMNVTAAFASLVGVGAAAMISIKFGEDDYLAANKIFGNVLSLNLILGILVGALGLIFLDPILLFFGASKQTLPYAHDYMQVIMMGNVILHLYFGLNGIIRASGFPKLSMNFTILSVILNCIFTPLFIYQFDWGIKGAATGTILAQIISLAGQFYHFTKKGNILHLNRHTLSLKWQYIKNIISIGLSPFSMNLAACVIVILINRGLSQYGGDMAVGAYGILNRVVFLFIMIILGLNQGMQPIAGYNYGALNFSRVREVTLLTIKYATAISFTGFILGELFPYQIAAIFTKDEELIQMTATGLRIVLVGFPIVGFQIVGTNLFTSINKAKTSIFLALSRQILLLIPALLILPRFFGTKGIWYSLPTADYLSFILTLIVFTHQMKQLTKKETEIIAKQKLNKKNNL